MTPVIGLCGRSGAGKGYVSSVFAGLGFDVIDTDAVYRTTVVKKGSPCLSELCREFGDEILDTDGCLDRRALSKIVFSDKSKLSRLNGITHGYIRAETEKLILKSRENCSRGVVVDAPVLFESGFDSLCDLLICVTCGDFLSLERICERDSVSPDAAKARLASQLCENELRRRCHYEIINDGRDVVSQVQSIVASAIKE